MNKKAFFYSIELYHDNIDMALDYCLIPELLDNIIDDNSVSNGNIKTLDLTNNPDDLHTMLDVYHHKTGYLFARASRQRPTGTVISRDYKTKKAQSLLPGVREDVKGIELYTYVYINYETSVLQIISAQGAPNETIIEELVNRFSDEYRVELIPIPNIDGLERFYGGEEASISSIDLELPNPDPAILQNVLGENGNEILANAANNHILLTIGIKSSISRTYLTTDTDTSAEIIDCIRNIIEQFGITRFKKASIKGKARNIKAREYNFYEENFYFPVDIPVYRMEEKRRIYYDEAELAQINLQNMQYAYNESKEYILPIIRR